MQKVLRDVEPNDGVGALPNWLGLLIVVRAFVGKFIFRIRCCSRRKPAYNWDAISKDVSKMPPRGSLCRRLLHKSGCIVKCQKVFLQCLMKSSLERMLFVYIEASRNLDTYMQNL
jgi:hypothetical protein